MRRGCSSKSDFWHSAVLLIRTHGGVCVFVLLSGGDSWRFLPLCHRETVTAGVWPTPRLSALLLQPLQPRLPPPLCLWPALSIHATYGSGQLETCSVQLGAAASWASPSFLHTSSPMAAHAHNHASADGHPIPGSGAAPRLLPHTRAVASAHMGTRRTRRGSPPLPDATFGEKK